MPRPTRSNSNLNRLINNDSNNQIMANTVENEVNQLQNDIQTTTVTNQTSINLANTTTSANLQNLLPNNQNSNQQLNEMIQLLSSNMNNLPSETSNNQLLLLMTKLIESQIKQNDNQNISKKTEIKIKNFDGKEFNLFKNDVGRYLLSTSQKRFIEHDIYKQDKPPSNKEISEDMHVQLFISTHCIPAIKSNVELNSKSAFEMWLFLENEYGQSGHRQINEAVNYICSGQLIAAKDLEDYINKFSLAFNTLEYNKMNVADQLKSKLFYRGLGQSRKLLEQHTINNKYNYSQTLAYVRDHHIQDKELNDNLQFGFNGQQFKRKPYQTNTYNSANNQYNQNNDESNKSVNVRGGFNNNNNRRGGFRGAGRYRGRGRYNPYRYNNSKEQEKDKNKQTEVTSEQLKDDLKKRLQIPIGKKCNVVFNYFNLIHRLIGSFKNLLFNHILPVLPIFVRSLIFSLNIVQNKYLWIFDTGASDKICNNIKLFTEIKYCDRPYQVAYSISGDTLPIVGIGNVRLPLKSGIDLLLEEVRYMPDALASCMNHKDPGDAVKYDICNKTNDIFMNVNINGCNKIFKLAQDTKIGPVIPLDLDVNDAYINSITRSGLNTDDKSDIVNSDDDTDYDSDIEDDNNLKSSEYSKLNDHLIVPNNASKKVLQSLNIHRMTGHSSPERTRLIMKRLGLDYEEFYCNLCVKHKIIRKINKVANRLATKPLEIISCDTSGKFRKPCYDGSQYFIVFVDHFSKMKWVKTFKTKDQVPKIIENFVNFIEKQCFPDFVIKIFRSDRGTEFKNVSVNEILTKRGIKTESSAPETHHQNGAAEQSMRMLKTKARILTDEYGHTPKNLFKNEAIKMACFLYNRTPNEQLGGNYLLNSLKF